MNIQTLAQEEDRVLKKVKVKVNIQTLAQEEDRVPDGCGSGNPEAL